ncbi:hypothetical protein ColLi_11415 [Colletotrichum liriopes]|uniref:Glyoxalase/fosfomycin resistance/dioxygenase domain-containing protein n=1 Tax=Colletotrichum liriopes TaxID=708192 RepID=A0AA37GYC4_9PEZI|nr:hypothetical protein ColLi_11415 [Colletotrichum liriopes]
MTSPQVAVRSLNHIAVSVPNIKAVVKWYTEVLGFKLIGDRILRIKRSEDPSNAVFHIFGEGLNEVHMAYLATGNEDGFEVFEFVDPVYKANGVDFEYNRGGFFHICVTSSTASRCSQFHPCIPPRSTRRECATRAPQLPRRSTGLAFTAIENIGWKYYLLYGIFNFAFVPIIWYWYVETANLSLEPVDRMFEIKHAGGKKMDWEEATRLAKLDAPPTVESSSEMDEMVMANHVESVKD